MHESAVSCVSDTLRYKLVVFDFDGTLADSFPFFLEVFDVLADTHGFKRLDRCGVRLAVVSSNDADNVRAVLGPDLARLIDDYDCGVAILGKRSRLRVLVKKSGIAREAVLCIGDEVRDIEAAHAEKLDAGAVTWGYATPKALIDARPSVVFSSFEEIVSCVKA